MLLDPLAVHALHIDNLRKEILYSHHTKFSIVSNLDALLQHLSALSKEIQKDQQFLDLVCHTLRLVSLAKSYYLRSDLVPNEAGSYIRVFYQIVLKLFYILRLVLVDHVFEFLLSYASPISLDSDAVLFILDLTKNR